ncbi:hypothetical protein D3C72_1936770 [compost metagenome]
MRWYGALRIASIYGQAPMRCSSCRDAGLMADTRKSGALAGSKAAGACCSSTTIRRPLSASAAASAAPTMPPPTMNRSACSTMFSLLYRIKSGPTVAVRLAANLGLGQIPSSAACSRGMMKEMKAWCLRGIG